MNRAPAILAEWDAATAATGGQTSGEARRDAEIDQLRQKLTAKNAECTRLQRQLDAAVTAIAALHHDNAVLRDELGRSRTTNVRALPGAERTREPRPAE